MSAIKPKQPKQSKRTAPHPASVSLCPPRRPLPPHALVLAPMVGASELAFRLLCRRHGAQLCYTPMMHSSRFASDAAYRAAELCTAQGDGPLVAHFCGNDGATLLAAARLAERASNVVAVDLNLGCPQRSAHSGHYGAFLCADAAGRERVLGMVSTLAHGLSVPVFCKIRLLDEGEAETVAFAQALERAGCALLAVHGRLRGSPMHRRSGPADLAQVAAVKSALAIPVLTNGNVRCSGELLAALAATGADGVMSAEGALDDPAIFGRAAAEAAQRKRKLRKRIDALGEGGGGAGGADPTAAKRSTLLKSVDPTAAKKSAKRLKRLKRELAALPKLPKVAAAAGSSTSGGGLPTRPQLALEYLALCEKHGVLSGGPSDVPCARFHVRRICRDALAETRLLPRLEAASSLAQLGAIVRACVAHAEGGVVALEDAEAIEALGWRAECERRNRDKRKEFEARMARKARREGKPDDTYFRAGRVPPTDLQVAQLRAMPEQERMGWWSARFGQHCLAFHATGTCVRSESEHGCAFLHAPPTAAAVAEEPNVAPSWLRESEETPEEARLVAAAAGEVGTAGAGAAAAEPQAGRGNGKGLGPGAGKGGRGQGKGGGKGARGKGKGGKGHFGP